MIHVTRRLTAKNRDQLRNPTLGNRVWATFTFLQLAYVHGGDFLQEERVSGGANALYIRTHAVSGVDLVGKLRHKSDGDADPSARASTVSTACVSSSS